MTAISRAPMLMRCESVPFLETALIKYVTGVCFRPSDKGIVRRFAFPRSSGSIDSGHCGVPRAFLYPF
ncbi:hypothetical protein CEXT_723621 [Caerostris extrusa]|uniref:Uncharacterized protein n=1 Tax=Caerostris extrusa TaxID=172846 RepID=A0AAV4M3N9_CAEEX|nr:hypothetical protein CEXT_723621 [Caerostris extrusa]